MTTSKQELARRIQVARDAAGLTQLDLATEIGISRSAVAEIELANRAVSGLELERIAYALGRDLRDFLAVEFREEDVLSALFRASAEVAESGEVVHELRKCLAIARELQALEKLLDIPRSARLATTYVVETPASRWDAIQQGQRVADAERRRLGLGRAPIADMADVLDSQGVRTALVSLPDDISGLTITGGSVAPFVAVSNTHAMVRRRFSFAHEFCHVLLDRALQGRISRTADRDDLLEVRCNAFAATFLMPEDGVRDAVESLGKGQSSRMAAAVFDENDAVKAERRTEPRSQDIQLYDVLQLAARFGASPMAMIYRLRNLRLVTENELTRLRDEVSQQRTAALAKALDGPLASEQAPLESGNHNQRFVLLALEAYRRDKISLAKLRELMSMVRISPGDVDAILSDAGLLDDALTA